jgi:UTP--glucose-1-phosphate uridylyltransferase
MKKNLSNIGCAVFPNTGMGYRLAPLTIEIPKVFLPLGYRSFLHWAMREAQMAGIEEFIFVLGPNISREKFKEKITNSKSEKYDEQKYVVVKEWFSLLEKVIDMVPLRTDIPGGFASVIASTEGNIKSNRFLVIMPDTIVLYPEHGSKKIIETAKKYDHWIIGLTNIKREQYNEFGVVKTTKRSDKSLIINYAIEKPGKVYRGKGMGISRRYIFSQEVFNLIRESIKFNKINIQKSGFHITEAINNMAQKDKVTGVLIESPFFHVGTFNGYFDAWQAYLKSIRK